MDNFTGPPLAPLEETAEHGSKTKLIWGIVGALTGTGLLLGQTLFFLNKTDGLKREMVTLKEDLNKKTEFIEGLVGDGSNLDLESGVLTLKGGLKVDGRAEVGGGLDVKGLSAMHDKLTVTNGLVIERALSADDYLFQFKTGENISFSFGAGSASGTDRNGLNFYAGAGLDDPFLTIGSAGHLAIKNSANSDTAFVIENAAGTALFVIDTKDGAITSGVVFDTKELIVGGGTKVTKLMHGTCAVDPADLAAGAVGTTTCTATGVKEGDKVFLVPPDSLEDDLLWWFDGVTGNDTVRIKFKNDNGAALNGSSRTWSWASFR